MLSIRKKKKKYFLGSAFYLYKLSVILAVNDLLKHKQKIIPLKIILVKYIPIMFYVNLIFPKYSQRNICCETELTQTNLE
jgi:hypothetical protein